MKLKLWLQSATAAGAIFATAGMAFSEGMLRYATVGEPPSLDQHVITSDLATTIAHHMVRGSLYVQRGKRTRWPACCRRDAFG